MLAPSRASSSRSRGGGAGGRVPGAGSLSCRRSLTCCRQHQGRSGLHGCRSLPLQLGGPHPHGDTPRVRRPLEPRRASSTGTNPSLPQLAAASNRQARTDGESRVLLKCLFFRGCCPPSHTSPCLCPTAFPKD